MKAKARQPAKPVPSEYEALRAENLMLQRKIVGLEAKLVSAQNKIIALKERVPLSKLTDDELQEIVDSRPVKQ